MFQIVVVIVPQFELHLQIGKAFEAVLFVEFFLILSVTSLHCAVLGRFAGVNEIVDDIMFYARLI